MKIVKGKKLVEMSHEEFNSLKNTFKSTVVDFGTGDGRFVYKSALENSDTLFIGVEPGYKQLEEYSSKALKMSNVLYVVGSVELLPSELIGCADKLCVLLPWGTLLQTIVKAENQKFVPLLKDNSEIEVLLGFHPDLEPSESERLGLESINKESIQNFLIPEYKKTGFELLEFKEISKAGLKDFETTWAKKLTFGKVRPMFFLRFRFFPSL